MTQRVAVDDGFTITVRGPLHLEGEIDADSPSSAAGAAAFREDASELVRRV